MPSKYLYRVNARRNPQQGSNVQTGLQVGQEVGKLIGGLAGAIKGAQRDAAANRLMDEQSIGDQPGAGQTQDLGTLPDDSALSDQIGQDRAAQSLSSLPADTSTFTNPSTGNVEPLQGQGSSDDVLNRAIAAASLQGSGPTVGSAPSGGLQPSQPTTGGGTDFSLNPSDYSAGGTAFGAPQTGAGTVGGLIHTGGVQEMDLRKEMLAQQLQKAAGARAAAKDAADAADAQAQASGTGRYALDAALKRAQLARTLGQPGQGGKTKAAVKNPPAENIGSEPVLDQSQLVKHVDGIYGNGTFADITSNINTATVDPNDPSMVLAGNPEKPIHIPLSDAQIFVRQQNALRLKQGLSAFRVPGEDQSVGATAGNPYIAKTNLDVYSRAPGTWVRLPNGRVAQVPGRQ